MRSPSRLVPAAQKEGLTVQETEPDEKASQLRLGPQTARGCSAGGCAREAVGDG